MILPTLQSLAPDCTSSRTSFTVYIKSFWHTSTHPIFRREEGRWRPPPATFSDCTSSTISFIVYIKSYLRVVSLETLRTTLFDFTSSCKLELHSTSFNTTKYTWSVHKSFPFQNSTTKQNVLHTPASILAV